MQCCPRPPLYGVEQLVFASTSSVNGANTQMHFSEHPATRHPLTLYAATKKADRKMAHRSVGIDRCVEIPPLGARGRWRKPGRPAVSDPLRLIYLDSLAA
jgi:hypothetical protein